MAQQVMYTLHSVVVGWWQKHINKTTIIRQVILWDVIAYDSMRRCMWGIRGKTFENEVNCLTALYRGLRSWVWKKGRGTHSLLMFDIRVLARCRSYLMAHNWQKWKSRFLSCPCHKIYREEAVGLKNLNHTLKKCDFCQYMKFWTMEIWYFVNNCLIRVRI